MCRSRGYPALNCELLHCLAIRQNQSSRQPGKENGAVSCQQAGSLCVGRHVPNGRHQSTAEPVRSVHSTRPRATRSNQFLKVSSKASASVLLLRLSVGG